MKIILLIITLAVCVFSRIQPGDTLTLFGWYQNEGDSMLQGCMGHLINDTLSDSGLKSTFWMPPKYIWWQKLFPKINIGIKILTSDTVPERVTQHCSNYDSAQWINGIRQSYNVFNFVFPIIDHPYGRYDYFTVDVNDTMELDFYGARDSIMVGTFVHKEPDSRGAVNILARNAIIVELTDGNSTRIGSVRFNWKFKPQLIEYFKFDVETFKRGASWYGVTFIDTSNVEPYIEPIVTCDSIILKDSIIIKDSLIITERDSIILDTSYVVIPRDSIVIKDSVAVTVRDSINLIDSTVVHVKDSINIRDTTIVTVKDSINIIDSVRISIKDSLVVKDSIVFVIDSMVNCTYQDSATVIDTIPFYDTIPFFKIDSLSGSFYLKNFGMFKNPKITIQEDE